MQVCDGDWNTNHGGGLTAVQHWTIAPNNVNEWDQTKFSRQLTDRACSPTNVKSNYDPATLSLATRFEAGSTRTAGRVTAALGNSAGLRRVDCGLGQHPKIDLASIGEILRGAAQAVIDIAGEAV